MASNTTPGELATSRIEIPDASTSVPVNASGTLNSLDEVKKRLRLTDDGVASILRDVESKVQQAREQHLSTLEKDWGCYWCETRRPGTIARRCAFYLCCFNGNFKEMDAKVRAKQAALEAFPFPSLTSWLRTTMPQRECDRSLERPNRQTREDDSKSSPIRYVGAYDPSLRSCSLNAISGMS